MSGNPIDRAVEVATGLDINRVSDETLQHVGNVIADTVGVIRAGGRIREFVRLVEIDEEQGLVAGNADAAADGPQRWPSTVLTTPTRRSSAEHAAYLNGTAGTFLELDEGMRPTGHPAMHVVPAALSVAERTHARGSDLLRAVIAGYEITFRLFRTFRLRYPVHPHGHFGAVGAAVAAAILDGVDPVEAARIAGVTPLLPVWHACYDGATSRNTYTGIAARIGVRACALARAGFSGSARALRVAYGEVSGELVDEDVLTAVLDYSSLGITRNYFKVHSACALTHAAIEAVTGMTFPRDAMIRSVRVETVQNNMKLDRQPQPNSLSARFSMQYAVAAALLLGRSDPDAFEFRPEVAELAHKVTVEQAPDLEKQWPDASPARVTVEWDNSTQTRTVDNPQGHHTRPLTDRDLRDKFAELFGVDGETWWDKLVRLGDVDDCSDLFAELS